MFASDDYDDTTDEQRDWLSQLRDEIEAQGASPARQRNAETLAEYPRVNDRLGYTLAVNEADLVTEWEWQETKDLLETTSLVDHPDQRTWVGKGP